MAIEESSRRMTVVCQAGVFLGAALVLSGLLWKATLRPSSLWSPEQAKEFTDARNALHELSYDHEGASGVAGMTSQAAADRKAARTAAQARFDRISADLEHARTTGQQRGNWLVRFGVAAVVLFGVGYLSSRR